MRRISSKILLITVNITLFGWPKGILQTIICMVQEICCHFPCIMCNIAIILIFIYLVYRRTPLFKTIKEEEEEESQERESQEKEETTEESEVEVIGKTQQKSGDMNANIDI